MKEEELPSRRPTNGTVALRKLAMQEEARRQYLEQQDERMRIANHDELLDKKKALRLAFYASLIALMNRIQQSNKSGDSSDGSTAAKNEFKSYALVYQQLIPATNNLVDSVLKDSIVHKSTLLETGNLLLMMQDLDHFRNASSKKTKDKAGQSLVSI